MKRLLLPVLCLAALTAAAAPAPHRAKAANKIAKVETTKHIKKRLARHNAAATAIWRPATQEIAYYVDGEWLDLEKYDITYTPDGKAATELYTDLEGGTLTRTTYTYDEYGYLTRQLTEFYDDEGETFENDNLLERKYDTIVKSLIIDNNEQNWDGTEWESNGNVYKREITRDDKGNITSTVISVLFDGAYDPTQKYTVEYGEDGKATSIKEEILDYDYDNDDYIWVDGEYYYDIEWEATDGQIYQVDNLFLGENRIKSAKNIDGEGYEYDLTVIYTDLPGCYTATYKETDGIDNYTATQTFTTLDEYGSYTNVVAETYVEDDESYTEITTETAKYDAYDNELLYEIVYEMDGFGEFIEDRIIGTVEYDPTYGYPLTLTVQMFDYETEEMANYALVKFGGYSDVAGIGTIDAQTAPVFYNLQGIAVDGSKLAPGIYIRRQGTKATKVLVK